MLNSILLPGSHPPNNVIRNIHEYNKGVRFYG